MAERKFIEEYENSAMSLAVSEMLEEYGKELEEEFKSIEDIQPSSEALEKFKKALDREYRKGRLRSFCKASARFGRYAVTICAAVIVIFSISIVSVDALRFRFLEWLTSIHSSHTVYNDSNELSNIIIPEYLPNGYILQQYNKEDLITTETFTNENKSQITIVISEGKSNAVLSVDNESSYSETILINDNTGVYLQKETVQNIFWNDERYFYMLTANDALLSKEEIVKVAQSLKR